MEFSDLNDYLILQVIDELLETGTYQDVVNLMCTCLRLSMIGQVILTNEYQRISNQPPSLISHSFSGSEEEPKKWIDTRGHSHFLDESYQSFQPSGEIEENPTECQQWFDPQGKTHRDGDLPAVIVHSRSVEIKYWYRHGIHLRGLDRPASVFSDGRKRWYQDGLLHREGDQPALINHHGHKEWWFHDQPHRDGDNPAIIYPSGRQEWYQHGLLHREGDLPASIDPDGRQEWYRHGLLHRDGDQPALIASDGTQSWWQRGYLHREGDQPAVIWASGRKEWYRHGEKYQLFTKI